MTAGYAVKVWTLLLGEDDLYQEDLWYVAASTPDQAITLIKEKVGFTEGSMKLGDLLPQSKGSIDGLGLKPGEALKWTA